jgi:predicted DNA-binding transcriptional regulator AlpA
VFDNTNELALRNFDVLPASAYVKRVVVQALCSCSDEQVDRLVKAGRLPTPIKISSRVNVWNVGELRAAMARLAGQDADGEMGSLSPGRTQVQA